MTLDYLFLGQHEPFSGLATVGAVRIDTEGMITPNSSVRFHGTWNYPRQLDAIYGERDVPGVNCFPSCFSPMFENVRCRGTEAERLNHGTVTFSQVLSHLD
uniref:Radical SAM protein n=1 Tax=Bursaphelenchus xylophilus TaxID=6326 RepID=A0A1I7SEJ0_BURXY